MTTAPATANPLREMFAAFTRNNVDSCLEVVRAFCQWHRQMLLGDPGFEERLEHNFTARQLLLMLRMLQAATADPGSPVAARRGDVEAAARMVERCWETIHRPMPEAEAEALLREHFPE